MNEPTWKRSVYVKEADRPLWQAFEKRAEESGESLSSLLAAAMRAALSADDQLGAERLREAGILQVKRARPTRGLPHEKLEIEPDEQQRLPKVTIQRFDPREGERRGDVGLFLGGRYMVREVFPGSEKTTVHFAAVPSTAAQVVMDALAGKSEEGE